MLLSLRMAMYFVNDLEKAKEWYSRVLNSDPSSEDPGSVSFFVGGDRLLLLKIEGNNQQTQSGGTGFWAVSNVEEDYQRLLDLGAEALSEIRDMGNGILTATLRDPFGNFIGIGGTGGKIDNQAIEDKPSQTALWTTMMRAFAAYEPLEEMRGADQLAEIFLPQDLRNEIKKEDSRQEFHNQHFIIGICEYVLARTRFFDAAYSEALENGIEQIVLLGAGYDTRPYRLKDTTGDVRIFELDIAPTQNHKKRCLADANVEIPHNLSHVPINFNKQTMDEVLAIAGFQTNKRTLFIWEGVTYYLQTEAVTSTLAFINTSSAKGSIIVFDYIAMWPGIFEAYGVKELIQLNSTRQSGETASGFSLEEGAIESFLQENGFRLSQHYNAEEMEQNFLTKKDGSLYGKVTGSLRLVKATT